MTTLWRHQVRHFWKKNLNFDGPFHKDLTSDWSENLRDYSLLTSYRTLRVLNIKKFRRKMRPPRACKVSREWRYHDFSKFWDVTVHASYVRLIWKFQRLLTSSRATSVRNIRKFCRKMRSPRALKVSREKYENSQFWRRTKVRPPFLSRIWLRIEW